MQGMLSEQAVITKRTTLPPKGLLTTLRMRDSH